MKKKIITGCVVILFSACVQKNKKEVIIGMDEGKDSVVKKPFVKLKDDSGAIKSPFKPVDLLADDSIFANGSKPVNWNIAGISDVKGLKLFVQHLQYLVAADRKIEISSYIRFPLSKSIKNVKDFQDHYYELITPAIKKAIAKTNLRQLQRNKKGVMIGGGKVRIAQQGKDFKIIAINN